MFNKKIILSVLILGFVATLAGAGTFAYFDSSVPVNDNTITAGSIYLTPVDGSGTVLSALTSFSVGGTSGIAPGTPIADTVWHVKNTGTLPGTLTATVTFTGASGIPHLTTTIAGTAISSTSVSPITIPLGILNAGATKDITASSVYVKDLLADQNTEMGKTVKYDVTFTLIQ
jgi:spore coat-associated protein N